jgi:hypothetical protein
LKSDQKKREKLEGQSLRGRVTNTGRVNAAIERKEQLKEDKDSQKTAETNKNKNRINARYIKLNTKIHCFKHIFVRPG